MWVNLSQEQIDTIITRVSLTTGADDPLIKHLRYQLEPDPNYQAFTTAARGQYVNDDCEIDEDARLSRADDGAWVMSWVWVSNEEADIEEPDKPFEVQMLIGSSWENEWHEDEQPLRFATEQDAEDEITDHIKECTDAYHQGRMSDVPTRDQFRIVNTTTENEL